ncbi:MAG: pitrilysin family protein [Actinomycetaceae bacterium]|nr:pitrilysin family protein [Actinomycetaceae bacterium]
MDLPLPASPSTLTQDFADGDTLIRRTVLECGTRVITQQVPATRSVSLSAWVPVGSRDESPQHGGSTHFLEHLLFKGTRTRSAFDIAVAFDSVGGESNAETGKETTSYYARIVDEDADMALRVLLDMVTDSQIDPGEFDIERGVILDELAMSDDSPMDVIHDAFALAVHGDTPLGRPVGGTPEAIRAISRDDVWDHYRASYTPDNLVIAAAGHVDHEHLIELVQSGLADSSWAELAAGQTVPRPRRSTTPLPSTQAWPREVTTHRDIEQAHIIVGAPSIPADDARRPVMSVLVNILGGSMSSRLFQEIRERRGLAYTTYAFDAAYSDAGAFGMYAGTSAKNASEVQALMLAELHSLAEKGPTEEELQRVRGQVRGSLALAMESNASRMSRLGRSEIHGYYRTIDQLLDRIHEVSAEQVRDLAAELSKAPPCIALLNPKNA